MRWLQYEIHSHYSKWYGDIYINTSSVKNGKDYFK